MDLAERFALVLEATNEGSRDFDVITGRVIYSPRWKELIGYRDHELPNRTEEWEQRVHPDDYPRVLTEVIDYIAGRIPAYDTEYRFRHRDGSHRWVNARGVMRFNADGKPVRFAGSCVDITERKQAEARSWEERRALSP